MSIFNSNDGELPKVNTKQSKNHSKLTQARAEIRELRQLEDKLRDNSEKTFRQQRIEQLRYENKYKEKLEAAGKKFDAKEQKKALENYNKEEIALKLRTQAQLYKEQTSLNKAEAEAKKELNLAILESSSTTLGQKLKAQFANIGDELKKGVNESAGKFANTALNFASSISDTLNTYINSYSEYQSTISGRIQGSGKTFTDLENTISDSLGITPYVKTSEIMENLSKLVSSGVVYNVEQRAFLQSIKDDIVQTFDATEASLLRIIKIQQVDSTASRLGLESYLEKALNNWYDTTEYLSNSFDTVTNALLEATSTMSATSSTSFEYTVQKWLGSLESVGLSGSTISNISEGIGYLGSGDISSLNSSEAIQNLLVMASSNAGLDYAQLLTTGLDASNTNKLLQSLVTYVQGIARSSDNNVVLSEYAKVFGLTMSDLQAVKNLSKSQISEIGKNSLSYSGSIEEVSDQLSAIGDLSTGRMNLSTMTSNVWDNLLYGLGTNIAKNTALYATWKVTDLIQGVTGGINIPFVSALGSGVDLETTAENLIKTGIVGISSLGMIGDMVSGINNTIDPSNILNSFGITGTAITRDNSIEEDYFTNKNKLKVTNTKSRSAFIGNSSGSDIYDSALTSANDAAEKQLIRAKEEQSTEPTATDNIYSYLIDKLDSKMDELISFASSLKNGTTVLESKLDENQLIRLINY